MKRLLEELQALTPQKKENGCVTRLIPVEADSARRRWEELKTVDCIW